MKIHHRHHRGYVLLTTIGLLVLASTLLVAVGRAAVDHALLARRSQDELQRKWGIISARAAVLPYSEQTLSRLEADGNGAVPAYRSVVQLGDSLFTLLISDEQAKANVNALLDESEKSAVEDRIRDTLAGSGVGNSVFLRPSTLFPGSDASPQSSNTPNVPPSLITGFGQVFDKLAPEKLTGGKTPDDFGATANITCWGNGAMNIMRAPEPALQLGLGHALTKLEISRLVTERDSLTAVARTDRLPTAMLNQAGAARTDPDPLNRLLSSARIDPKKRGEIALISHSNCYSLWIIVNDRQRLWTSFFVADRSDPAKTRVESFVW